MIKYLITGGAGFIGSNFIRNLLNRHQEIKILNFDKLTYAGNLNNLSDLEKDIRYSFVKGDICDIKKTENVFNQFHPDYVVNFAAESHVDKSIHYPDVFVTSNVLGVQNLLQISLQQGVKKYLQISTDEVYGSLGAEGLFTEKTLLDPSSPYSASKASADLLTQAYFHTFNLPINITRCSNNYGPYQFPEKLIPLTILNCLKGRKIPVYGDGLNVRDWIHVDDHCSAIDLVLHNGVVGEIYNVGANNERSNIEIVKLIIQILAELRSDLKISEALISYVEDRKGHDRRYAIDSTKIQSTFYWKPKIDFNYGLTETIKWYLHHQEWLNSVINNDYLTYYDNNYGKNKFVLLS
ncbi:MAG: dTDP-glucose 4,6-dehydratase [Methanomicrobiales archaeon HGW-Methanomicrobiales-1]|nr:MAG: dTDP-glucose 4,6-dehydratase [Methanomicrobiales archaeon HGW-Methanomicrobiales-1]